MRLRLLLTELRQRGVFKVAAVYLAMGLAALEGLTHLFHNFEAPDWVLKVLTTLIILGFPVACLMAWGFQFSPQGIRAAPLRREENPSTPEPQPVAVPQPEAAGRPSVAVLPFVDMSAGGDQQYFGDGIAEELISALSRVEGLRVAARTSTFALHAAGAGMQQYGDVLHVAYVLEGSVRRAGERVRITAQLIDVASGYHLFSQSYDRRIEDVLAIQNEIAHELLSALLPRFGMDPQTPLLPHACCSPAAYELRLRARHAFYRSTVASLDEAIGLLERAVALDPAYAAAWGDLAYTYSYRASSSDPASWLARAQVAASRAVALEPDSALALMQLAAGAAVLDYDRAEAERLYRRARETSIEQSFWAFNYSLVFLMPQGRYAEALEILHEARNQDPLAPDARVLELLALCMLRRQQEALAIARAVRAEDSPASWLAVAAIFSGLVEAGESKQAEELLEYLASLSGEYSIEYLLARARANGASGDKEANRRLLDAVMSHRRHGSYASPYAVGVIHVELAEFDAALDWFAHAVDARDPLFFYMGTAWYRVHPVIGKDPRFLALLRRIGLGNDPDSKREPAP